MSHYHSRSFVFTRAEHVVLKPIINKKHLHIKFADAFL